MDGLFGLVGNSVVIRLRSRKNCTHGDTIIRDCVCGSRSGTSLHVHASMCPVHAVWKWVSTYRSPGSKLFTGNIAHSSISFLRVALEARNVPEATRYGLHSLRRGAAQAIVNNGGDLCTLLRAGGWRSAAFQSYLDFIGIEKKVCVEHAALLTDIDKLHPISGARMESVGVWMPTYDT